MRIGTSAVVLTLAVATTSVIIFVAGHSNAATHTSAPPPAATNTPVALATATRTVTRAVVTHTASPVTAAHKAGSTAAHTYVGSSVEFQWGTAQVTIVVKGSVVTDLSAVTPHERAQSAYINDIAVPMLRTEVLKGKTAAQIKNIYGISGASMTSYAFYQSLLAALHTAKLM